METSTHAELHEHFVTYRAKVVEITKNTMAGFADDIANATDAVERQAFEAERTKVIKCDKALMTMLDSKIAKSELTERDLEDVDLLLLAFQLGIVPE